MPLFDTRVAAVLLRCDRNPFHHGTLGAVRSLGRAGVPVHVVTGRPAGPVSRSRYVRHWHPGPDTPGLTGLRTALAGVAEQMDGEPALLLAMDDVTAVSLDGLRAETAGPAARFLLPDQPSGLAARVADKASLAATCRRLGVPHPRTLAPADAEEAAAMTAALGLPVVAKWSRPWLLPPGTGLRSTVLARSVAQVRELYGRRAEAGSTLLLQQYLPEGRDLDWFFHAYCDRSGACSVAATGRKVRSWPDGAGLTAAGVWAPNPAVERTARDLVSALGYRGIADLDFRLDPRTGTYHLLDFNPRPGAQFRLFADPWGLDVVRAQHLDLTGRPVPDLVRSYGRRFVVENYAALSLLASPRPRTRAGTPRWGGGVERAWYASDDPVPALAMARAWAAHLARRAWAALRRAWRGRVPGRPGARIPAQQRPRSAQDFPSPRP
ncbi:MULTISPECIES: ATP-grasp domain-containing protein [unclassified Streptomyces]|uniref:carboxylate--amine ligase n=1 Tax=unclassified Streptomyces TaxID=2593676 RepID=UPI0008DCDC0E|nr:MULTISPECIES: ATP-grasp domain-containing protein [unclassified Streptomyces]OII70491.1 ATP-grasp domain-containing protein [Streptomyces sp. CC77]